jgi:hypothetical protein
VNLDVQAIERAIWRQRVGGILAAVAGAAICASTINDWGHQRLLESYLLAYLFWWMVSLGCLGVLAIYYLSGGRWGSATRPLLECGAMTMPLVALSFLPIAAEVERIYPWASDYTKGEVVAAETSADDAMVEHKHGAAPDVKRWYLNREFFLARAVGYFVVWLGLTYVLSARPRVRGRGRLQRRVAAGGLVLLLLTCTFASIDWGMSLDPAWYSTMYGALMAIGATVAGFAWVTMIAAALQTRSGADTALLEPQTLADLGTLMQAFLMLWAYCAFSQFLIIWSGNLPEENVWYVARLTGNWQFFGLAAAGLEFAVPFCLLLSRDVKFAPKRLAAVAMLVFVMQFAYLIWTIVPSLRPGPVAIVMSDIAVPIALGGIWVALFATLLSRRWPRMRDPKARLE